jgi:hypothetical protein
MKQHEGLVTLSGINLKIDASGQLLRDAAQTAIGGSHRRQK